MKKIGNGQSIPLELAKLVECTCRLLESQRKVPLSPGLSEGNETLLCAGAAFVKEAALSQCSNAFAERFAQEVVGRDSSYILDVAVSIGLNEKVVKRVVLTNDALSPATRLAGMLTCLEGLAHC